MTGSKKNTELISLPRNKTSETCFFTSSYNTGKYYRYANSPFFSFKFEDKIIWKSENRFTVRYASIRRSLC